MAQERWAVLVVWLDGEEEYLHPGTSGDVAIFPSRERAQEQRDFMWIGMEGECQSINVVRYA
jgi:hypothetical protein